MEYCYNTIAKAELHAKITQEPKSRQHIFINNC